MISVNIFKRQGAVGFLPVILLCLTFVLSSCDEHEHIDLDIHPGHILLRNGDVISSADYFNNGDSTAVGIIFSERIDDKYLAVMLTELSPRQFCDSVPGMTQSTSCDTDAYDGRTNTIALWNSRDEKSGHGSPLADAAYASHQFYQSDFIPSVKEMRMLYAHRHTVNDIIDRLNTQRSDYLAVPLSFDRSDGNCWYWTSTEVKDNQETQAWLFSMASGTMQETAKTIGYHARMVSYFYPYGNNKN